ncbi:MAG: PHP domain-containing protein [candidate division KSB1 bacterium]|nr:PHP domain-containing protein [candidate division KSB1 bacterium]
MRYWSADLHIHTVLSACADLSMGPIDIVKTALAKGLDIIAVTDHNSAENAAAVIGAAKDTPLLVIPGMEVYTREEAHVICLFRTLEDALSFQEVIYEHLPEGEYDGDLLGGQYVCDENENILGENRRFLAFPVDLPVHMVAGFVLDLDGIFYPAHIDRKSNSLLRALGFLPKNLPMTAVEIAQPLPEALQQLGFLRTSPYTIVRSSDAHEISQVGSKTTKLLMEAKSFDELKMALAGENGRRAWPAEAETPCGNCR